MQTFLPYPNFTLSAQCLDNRRLNKQITEAMQIHNVLTGASNGWANHPAVKMWRGHESALVRYGRALYVEWRLRWRGGRRGGRLEHKAGEFFMRRSYHGPNPSWLGNEAFHAAHRSNLLRKDAAWYDRFGWAETAGLPYVWPIGD
jgi:hypothetical protein